MSRRSIPCSIDSRSAAGSSGAGSRKPASAGDASTASRPLAARRSRRSARAGRTSSPPSTASRGSAMPESMHDGYDWRAEVRARIENANLAPSDQADIIEEIGQHLEQQFAELAPQIGAMAARERLLAQLRDDGFEIALEGRRRLAKPSRARVWASSSLLRDLRHGARSL